MNCYKRERSVDSVRGLPQAIWNLGTRSEEKTVSTLEGISVPSEELQIFKVFSRLEKKILF